MNSKNQQAEYSEIRNSVLFKAYDDEGIYLRGSRAECMNAIIEWLESEDAEVVYTENELVDMIHRFNWSKKHESGDFEFSGFYVEEVV